MLITGLLFRLDGQFQHPLSRTIANIRFDLSTTAFGPDMLQDLFASNVGLELGIAPDSLVGHFPRRCLYLSAHSRICFSVSGGNCPRFRTPRFSESRRASDEPPGRPRSKAR